MQPISCTFQQIDKPAGVTAGSWKIALYNPVSGQPVPGFTYAGADPEITFTDVPGGDYRIFFERLDTNSNLLGPRAQRDITVEGEKVDVPLAILVGGA